VNSEICVDANLVVKWYLFEELREKAVSLLDESDQLGITIIAPDLVLAEVGSTIRRAVHRGLTTADKGRMAMALLKRAPIQRFDVRDLFDDAWRIAETHGLPTLYDAYYLALAEIRGCDLWTADQRLINSVQGSANLRSLASYEQGVLRCFGI
jgi:predicted nucleic acid-binding protein